MEAEETQGPAALSGAADISGTASDPKVEADVSGARHESVNCAVCGSLSGEQVWTVADDLLHFPGEEQIVRCGVCGTLRMSPRPPFELRRRAFTDEYPLFDWALGRKQAQPRQRIAKFQQQINKITSFKSPGRLLDVGCGDGIFMLGMQEQGWKVRGIELHEKVAAFARDSLGLDVLTGAEHEVDWVGTYDCITLFGVIEDVDDPNALLERCHEHLAVDGLLVIQTHNIASWEARFFGRKWFNVESPRHVWHFSPGTLYRLLENNRFREEELLHYGSAYVTERSIENRRGRQFPSSLLDRLLRKAVISPAAGILPRLSQGIMIEAYCVKAGRAPNAPGPQLHRETK